MTGNLQSRPLAAFVYHAAMTPPPPGSPDALSRVSAFAGLAPDLLRAMWERMEPRQFAEGETLIRQDDPGDYLLVLLEGSASVDQRGADGRLRLLGEVRAGDVVGEMALITGESRGADVTANEPVRAAVLSASEFERLARAHPELGIVLTNLIAERLGRRTRDALGGKTLAGWRIERCVGRGGMAVVYEAFSEQDGRRVALKMMSHRLVYDAAALTRFRQEADVVETLDHENIARLYGRFSAYGTHFLIMEFLDGPGLDAIVARGKPLEEIHVRRIVGQLADALGYLHGRGLLHRDIKPSNVMLTREGVVKLMDFGLAKPMISLDERTATHELTLVGTPAYMAPEQLSGDPLDERVDVYALCCLAFVLLTATKPFDTKNLLDLVRRKLAFTVPAAESIGLGVSREMHELLTRGLLASRDERIESLAEYVAWAAPVDVQALGIAG